jgi:ribosomal protein S18 acetylase RimI-like enzyme
MAMSVAADALRIRPASDRAALAAVRALFEEYGLFLHDALEPDRYAEEMTSLAERYPIILLAELEGRPAAAGAVRPLERKICEMKRLYCRPSSRGRGVGRALCERLFEESRARGFKRMRLDTLERLGEALSLYRSLGFEKISPYNDTKLEGLLHMEKVL